ncbi:heterokaryon incompatibility protein-domain-containing protein [Xylaria sp. FL1777]|nr:heterokaryon incompatibility protein-domain-containing protein [Xylaria sp. FL1777]
MIATNSFTGRKSNSIGWPELQDSEASKPKSQRHRVSRWLARWRNKTAPLCQKCRDLKLDLSPLMAKPPDISELPKEAESLDMDELESRYTVHINYFSPKEAKASGSECSLCEFLLRCFQTTRQEGWLLGLPSCSLTLRPRFDRSTNVKKEGTMIHKQQIWVEFQPIEGEILVDLVDLKECRPTGKRRGPISPTADLKLLKWWLKNCDQRHSHKDIPSTVRPRIQAILDGRIFRVINTTTGLVEALTSLPTFVALSYVWGPSTGEPKNQPLKGGPVSDYPATIRDAIVTSKSLGYEWLWVDRVCIDQNSDGEKAKLIPYMKDIYTAAQLTIVAACGESAEDGLLGTQATPRKVLKPLILGPSVAVLPPAERFVRLMRDCVWSQRGWTFQEYVFSRRLLIVFKTEMFFTCGQRTFRESLGRRPVIDNKGAVDRWLFDNTGPCDAAELQSRFQRTADKPEDMLTVHLFLGGVADYSGRQFSVKEDRMGAFSGVISSAMSPMDQVSEEALLKHGHPLRFFESLLTWERGLFIKSSLLDPNKKLRVPSWSWAYTGYPVIFKILGGPPRSSDQYVFFNYSQLPNHDVLGLPSKSNPTGILLGLPVPDELIADRSWIESSPQESKSDPEGGEWATAAASISPLPKLHLLTLVFDARFLKYDDYTEEYMLAALGTTETSLDIRRRVDKDARPDRIYNWSLQPGCESLFPERGVSPRSRPFETFAIITGYPDRGAFNYGEWSNEIFFNLFVLLLEPTGEQDTYSRLGMNTIPFVWMKSYASGVIKKGRPRWQYIHLV